MSCACSWRLRRAVWALRRLAIRVSQSWRRKLKLPTSSEREKTGLLVPPRKLFNLRNPCESAYYYLSHHHHQSFFIFFCSFNVFLWWSIDSLCTFCYKVRGQVSVLYHSAEKGFKPRRNTTQLPLLDHLFLLAAALFSLFCHIQTRLLLSSSQRSVLATHI